MSLSVNAMISFTTGSLQAASSRPFTASVAMLWGGKSQSAGPGSTFAFLQAELTARNRIVERRDISGSKIPAGPGRYWLVVWSATLGVIRALLAVRHALGHRSGTQRLTAAFPPQGLGAGIDLNETSSTKHPLRRFVVLVRERDYQIHPRVLPRRLDEPVDGLGC